MARTRGSTVATRHWSSTVATRVAIGRHIHTRARARAERRTLGGSPAFRLSPSLSRSVFLFLSLFPLSSNARARARVKYSFCCLGGLCTGRVYRNVTREDSLSSAVLWRQPNRNCQPRARESATYAPSGKKRRNWAVRFAFGLATTAGPKNQSPQRDSSPQIDLAVLRLMYCTILKMLDGALSAAVYGTLKKIHAILQRSWIIECTEFLIILVCVSGIY